MEIELLNHEDDAVAKEIYAVFQESYRVESELIGSRDFPPLRRSVEDIKLSLSVFWSRKDSIGLVGIIEVEQAGSLIQITSLAVKPRRFREGIAASLIDFVLANFSWKIAEVQTANANIPAVSLYKKHGFLEIKSWPSKEGIELILLSKDKNST